MNAYSARNALLESIGFSDYEEYLRSSLWRGIRHRAVTRDQERCQVCKRTATHVHHGDYQYATIVGESIDALVCLCEACHQDIEFDGHVKRQFEAVQAYLQSKLKPPAPIVTVPRLTGRQRLGLDPINLPKRPPGVPKKAWRKWLKTPWRPMPKPVVLRT